MLFYHSRKSKYCVCLFADATVLSAPSSPSNLSTATLVGSNNSETSPQETEPEMQKVPDTETKTDNISDDKPTETALQESKGTKITSPEVAEVSEEPVKSATTGVQFKSGEKRASVPILESEQRRHSRTQVRRKCSEGQARREQYEEDRGRHEEQLSDESGYECLKTGPASRSASITTSVLQVIIIYNLDRLEGYYREWGLTVNVSKTKAMISSPLWLRW